MSVEFEGKKACIAPEGVFIIGTYDEKGVPNAMQTSLQTAPNSSHIYKSLQLPKDAYKYRLEMLYS